MSKWQKISSLFIVGVKDFQFDDKLRSFLKDFPVSGLALFNSPFDQPSNLWRDPDIALEAQYEFLRHLETYPLFLCVDQEGGRVRRLRSPYIQLPPAETIGRLFEEGEITRDLVFRIYKIVARQLYKAGISLNFAPVADLRSAGGHDVIGDRAFSEDLQSCIDLVQLFCEAFQTEKLASCLKHLPGHGSAQFDSHEKIAVLARTQREILEKDFQVFSETASFASAVMTAHIAFPENEDQVFSQSPNFIQFYKSRLPTHLKWITDDLATMKAVQSESASLKAIEAGHDFALLCGSFDEAAKQIEFVIRAFENKQFDFSNEQKWDLRIQHARECFTREIDLPPFEKWKKSIQQDEKEFQFLLEEVPSWLDLSASD